MRLIVLLLIGLSSSVDIKRTTRFFLYSPNETKPQELIASQPHSLTNSSFNVCFKTVFLITGYWQPNFDPEFVYAAKVIANKSYNAIVVNYITSFYFISVPVTGSSIAIFVRSLATTFGYNPKHMILIGFSLGAQVAGYAGSMSKVGRIMGIDPSGPFYDLFPSFMRLDRSDAAFVDTLHSSQDLGTRLPRVGHVRFVLNGGKRQPGCPRYERICSHFRSAKFTKSSLTRCVFTFQRCYSYLAFKLGLCQNFPTLIFGLDLDIRDVKLKAGERYFHDTTQEDYPFCNPEEETEPNYNGWIC